MPKEDKKRQDKPGLPIIRSELTQFLQPLCLECGDFVADVSRMVRCTLCSLRRCRSCSEKGDDSVCHRCTASLIAGVPQVNFDTVQFADADLDKCLYQPGLDLCFDPPPFPPLPPLTLPVPPPLPPFPSPPSLPRQSHPGPASRVTLD